MEGDLLATLRVSDLLELYAKQRVWRAALSAPGYEVPSFGEVRRSGAKSPLSASATRSYFHVSVSVAGQIKTTRVHRLVAEAFLGPAPFDGAQIAHNDGNSRNNCAANLRWASALENQRDRERHKTKTVGSDVFGAKLTEDAIPYIRRRIAAREPSRQIADDYGVSISTISLLRRGRIWRHV